jgi:hypothetical protein
VARAYHVGIATFVADADKKWVDNLLSHHRVPGVDYARQGLARRVSEIGIYHVALIRALTRDAGMGTALAVSLSARLLSPDVSRVPMAPGLDLQFDRQVFERQIDLAIAEAVEAVVPARRGRPPSSASSRR